MVATTAEKKQKTYMLLLKCPGTDCLDERGSSYQVRTTKRWIDRCGAPKCPRCELELEAEESNDEEVGS
jgi:hypothetical protein